MSFSLLPWWTSIDLGNRKIGWHQVGWLGDYLNHARTDEGALQNDSRKMRDTVMHKKATTFLSKPASITLPEPVRKIHRSQFFLQAQIICGRRPVYKKRYQLCFVPRFLQAKLHGVSVMIKYSTSSSVWVFMCCRYNYQYWYYKTLFHILLLTLIRMSY